MPTLPPSVAPKAKSKAKVTTPPAADARPARATVRLPQLTAPVSEAALDASVTFNWTPVEGAQAYEVRVAEDETFANVVCSVRTSEPQATIFDAFEPGRAYAWRVRHQDASGRWMVSTRAATFQTVPSFIPGRRMRSAASPTPLLPVGGAPVDGGSLALAWTPVEGATEYQLQIARASDFASPDLDLPLDPSSALTLVRLLPQLGVRYRWRIRAKSAGNWTPWSAPATFRAATDDEADAHEASFEAARLASDQQRAREAIVQAIEAAEAQPPHRVAGTSAAEAMSFILAIGVGFGVMVALVVWAMFLT
jgi:hypothetical protein